MIKRVKIKQFDCGVGFPNSTLKNFNFNEYESNGNSSSNARSLFSIKRQAAHPFFPRFPLLGVAALLLGLARPLLLRHFCI